MPRGKGIYDDEGSDEPKGGRPGPTDEGGEGGMATREHTPDVDESSEEPTALPLLGVATFAAAPIGRASKIAKPARHQLDLGVAVQRRIECDVVTGRVDVS